MKGIIRKYTIVSSCVLRYISATKVQQCRASGVSSCLRGKRRTYAVELFQEPGPLGLPLRELS